MGRLSESGTVNLKPSRDLTKELIDMIQRGSRRIQDRVREMAESVRVSPGCRNLLPAEFQTLCQACTQLSVSLPMHARLFCGWRGTSDTLPVIQADESRLFNAFDNLINNAIPEVPPGGSVTVCGRTNPAGASVCLSVIDTGKRGNDHRSSGQSVHLPCAQPKDRWDGVRDENREGCDRCPWRRHHR